MSTANDHLLTSLKEDVLTITLNRPKVNAFNSEMAINAQEIFKRAARDKRVRCVLLTGAGKVFSAGQDLTEIKAVEGTSFRYHLSRTYNPLVLHIRRLEKPVIAAINGVVSGAALGIALACDLRIAADTARFVVGFQAIGLVPDSAVSLLLPAIVGLGRASEYIFTNTPIDSQQALEIGLVNRVAPCASLPAEAFAWATQLAQGPTHAIGLAKRALNKAILPHLETLLDYEAYLQDIAGRGAEHKEGVQAFFEKRAPQFTKPAGSSP